MAEKRPMISVLMPVFNVAPYVAETIQSVLNQSVDDFEFVIVNDGSTDATEKVVARYEQLDDRIKYVCQPRRGITPTLNEGLRHCRGEFVARIDGDDTAMPQRFERQVTYLRDHPACVLVGSAVIDMDTGGQDLGVRATPLRHDEIVAQILHGGGCAMQHPAVMMRRADVEACGGYCEEFDAAQDRDLWLRLAERGRLANLPEPLMRLRRREDSITRSKRSSALHGKRLAARRYFERRGERLPRGFKIAHPRVPSTSDIARRSAWEAIKDGRRLLALRFAAKATVLSPFKRDNWWVIMLCLRPKRWGRTPQTGRIG